MLAEVQFLGIGSAVEEWIQSKPFSVTRRIFISMLAQKKMFPFVKKNLIYA
jgi:hypothetical protein